MILKAPLLCKCLSQNNFINFNNVIYPQCRDALGTAIVTVRQLLQHGQTVTGTVGIYFEAFLYANRNLAVLHYPGRHSERLQIR